MEKHECTGDEFEPVSGSHVTPERCFETCKDYSTVFAYGRPGTDRCGIDGCRCYCQKASKDGECNTLEGNSKFDLYRTNPMRADSKFLLNVFTRNLMFCFEVVYSQDGIHAFLYNKVSHASSARLFKKISAKSGTKTF